MSHCVPGSLVFWLLIMAYIGAFMCTTNTSIIHENGRTGEEGHNNGNYHAASLDSSADIGWSDSLLVEDTQPSPFDAKFSLLVKRITPKSIFVVPNCSGCPKDYQEDEMGGCVEIVKVNQAAQSDFLLQKLNSKFAPSSANNKNDNSDNSGPFHVSLPLGGLDSSNNNNNKNIPKDKDKQSITSITMKPTTDEEKEVSLLSSYNSINNSSSEIDIKKTELLQDVNLPITTTLAPEINAIEPQVIQKVP